MVLSLCGIVRPEWYFSQWVSCAKVWKPATTMTLYSQIPQISSLNGNAWGPNILLIIFGTLGVEGVEARPYLCLPQTLVLSGKIFSFSSLFNPSLAFSILGDRVSHILRCPCTRYIANDDFEYLAFCLYHPSPGITVTCHHTQVIRCQDPVHAQQASYQIYCNLRLETFSQEQWQAKGGAFRTFSGHLQWPSRWHREKADCGSEEA